MVPCCCKKGALAYDRGAVRRLSVRTVVRRGGRERDGVYVNAQGTECMRSLAGVGQGEDLWKGEPERWEDSVSYNRPRDGPH